MAEFIWEDGHIMSFHYLQKFCGLSHNRVRPTTVSFTVDDLAEYLNHCTDEESTQRTIRWIYHLKGALRYHAKD